MFKLQKKSVLNELQSRNTVMTIGLTTINKMQNDDPMQIRSHKWIADVTRIIKFEKVSRCSWHCKMNFLFIFMILDAEKYLALNHSNLILKNIPLV